MGTRPKTLETLFKLKDDMACRQEWAERVGLGFELVHIVSQNATSIESEKVA